MLVVKERLLKAPDAPTAVLAHFNPHCGGVSRCRRQLLRRSGREHSLLRRRLSRWLLWDGLLLYANVYGLLGAGRRLNGLRDNTCLCKPRSGDLLRPPVSLVTTHDNDGVNHAWHIKTQR